MKQTQEYRVTTAGTGAHAAEWLTVATGFNDVRGAAAWMYDSHDTDNLEVPLRVERNVGGLWQDCFVVLPAGVGNVAEWERAELMRALCNLLGDFRRACYRDGMGEDERRHFAGVLDMVEGAIEGSTDTETLRAIVGFRRALLGSGLSEMERGELAMPGGFLDQVEAFVLQVIA